MIRDSVVFVTGSNRGIGLPFVQELLAAGPERFVPQREIRIASRSMGCIECVWM
jgi:NAD(P)-dependent dehydrogenase (short-subunit alcohol dehydrogenase family)